MCSTDGIVCLMLGLADYGGRAGIRRKQEADVAWQQTCRVGRGMTTKTVSIHSRGVVLRIPRAAEARRDSTPPAVRAKRSGAAQGFLVCARVGRVLEKRERRRRIGGVYFGPLSTGGREPRQRDGERGEHDWTPVGRIGIRVNACTWRGGLDHHGLRLIPCPSA